jgi:hypothetical protein
MMSNRLLVRDVRVMLSASVDSKFDSKNARPNETKRDNYGQRTPKNGEGETA